MMMTLKERRRIRFFKIINFCHQMIDLLNGATVQGIILDEESCRLTILNNLNHVPFSKYKGKFDAFVARGVKGELSRFYISVNERNNESTIKDLQHYLLDHPTFSATKLESKVTSLAMQPQNAAEHKWLFDYDSSKDLDRFVEDLTLEGFKENEIEVHKTVHNYAVIVSHGFDSRKILAKYKDCELKRDAMLCVEWGIKE